MNVKQALSWGYQQIKSKKIKTAALEAEVLLAFILKKNKEFLYTHPTKKLTQRQLDKFKKLITRRKKFEPIAYLTNQKEFFDFIFYVDHNVLVPRPETELMVELIINLIKNSKHQILNPKQSQNLKSKFPKTRILTIADIGTGSGCIAISLAKNLPKAKIYAIDISSKALKIAKKNAKANQTKINFNLGNLLEPTKTKKIDIIVANLPYLDSNYKNLLNSTDTKGLKFEPSIALKAGKFGLKIYEKLFLQINNLKHQPELIFCEIGHAYRKELTSLIKKTLPNYQWQIEKDLAKKNRVLILKKRWGG
ncbi:MAG: peptide chain release factor N(5)-glutamine methyltransferase [Candidatus Buchananbacteria bacterium]|nr:peptide chain release factor N(5)-glutamine methyltransferase [Candidatus Buchananbacteria bacterium]